MYLLAALPHHEGSRPYSAITIEVQVTLLGTVRHHELRSMMDHVSNANASSASLLYIWPTTARRNGEMAEEEHMGRMFAPQSTSKTSATSYICINQEATTTYISG